MDSASIDAGQGSEPAEGGQSEEPMSVIGAAEQPNSGPSEEAQAAWELAEGLDPEMVVGKFGDQALTARELQSGYLRQQDYTKKTTELADQRKTQQQAVDFYTENAPDIERLYSPDANVRKEIFLDLAKRFEVDLGGGQQRGADGRYATQAGPEAGDGMLEQIRDSYGEDSVEFRVAAQNAQLQAQVAELTGQFGQLMTGVQSAQQQQSHREEAERTAAAWRGAGLSDPDVEGAMAFVGKPMTPDQAMWLHNKERIVAHNLRAAQRGGGQVPDDPGSANRSPVQAGGKSLREFTEARFGIDRLNR